MEKNVSRRMKQRSPRDQFVFGSAMSSGRVAKPIDSEMPRKVLQTTTPKILQTEASNSHVSQLFLIGTTQQNNLQQKYFASHINKSPIKAMICMTNFRSEKLKQFNVVPHPQDPVLSCSSIYKIYCIFQRHFPIIYLQFGWRRRAHTQSDLSGHSCRGGKC